MVDREKEDFMSQIEHYRAVLEDLQKQRNLLNLKITEIDQAISSLHRLIPEDVKPDMPVQAHVKTHVVPIGQLSLGTVGRYSGMSVRWAILNLLSEDATGPMSTGEIAVALRQGGITSNAASFAGNVSAILSVMSRQKGEVSAVENGWVISPIGRQAWAHIRAKREAQQQANLSSNVQ
jgi:hypothetical protein